MLELYLVKGSVTILLLLVYQSGMAAVTTIAVIYTFVNLETLFALDLILVICDDNLDFLLS